MTENLLTLRDIGAWYGTAQVMFGVSLDLAEGETVGLLGRNGAGKSTTMKSVFGLEARFRGSVRLSGQEVIGQAPEDVARMGVAWVPPDRRIFPTLSVMDNLRLGAAAAGHEVDVDELVDALPILSHLITREGYQLSGGEQQAVAIARALASRPRVLLLDEPTEGLAPLIVQQLRESIASLPERFNVAVLLAEQNLQFVLGLATRVYVLETGRLVHAGAADDFAQASELQHRFLSFSAGDNTGTSAGDPD